MLHANEPMMTGKRKLAIFTNNFISSTLIPVDNGSQASNLYVFQTYTGTNYEEEQQT